MKIEQNAIEIPVIFDGKSAEKNPAKRVFFKENAANIIARAAAWGIDVSITGVLATLVSKILGNNFQDTFFGPFFLYLVCGFVYGSLMECSPWQATLGKHVLRMKVIRTNGLPLNSWHAASRNLLRALVLLSVGISYVFAIFHPQRAAIHDLLSSTRVVKSKSPAFEDRNQRPSSVWHWMPFAFFMGFSILAVLILGFVTAAIVSMRGIVNDGYTQLQPFMEIVEKSMSDESKYPVTVTALTNGIKDDNLLPGSGYKARYQTSQGQFVIEAPHLDGQLIVGFLPPGHVYNDKGKAAWVCLGQASKPETQKLYSILTPAHCATKPFHEKIQAGRSQRSP